MVVEDLETIKSQSGRFSYSGQKLIQLSVVFHVSAILYYVLLFVSHFVSCSIVCQPFCIMFYCFSAILYHVLLFVSHFVSCSIVCQSVHQSLIPSPNEVSETREKKERKRVCTHTCLDSSNSSNLITHDSKSFF